MVLILLPPTGCNFDVMSLFGRRPVISMQFGCSLQVLFVRSTLRLCRFLLSVCTWGCHALSVLPPTCCPQPDQRLISSQGSISFYFYTTRFNAKDSAMLGSDCSLPVARCTGLWHNR